MFSYRFRTILCPPLLTAGDELTLLPEIEGNFAGGDCKLRDFSVTKGGKRP